ncbi:MAG: protein-L-isoaspartate(D-aspartate) O-methyltransferase [archaeon]
MKKALVDYWLKSGIITNKRIIDAFLKIRREDFVLDKSQAYDDNALPILYGQTISQPTTIIIMLEALELEKGDNILEIGTGSGYNAALIAEIIKPGIVYSTEIIKKLCDFSSRNLKKAGIKNVKIFNVDGSKGLEKYKLYDKIIVTAACPKIPEHLLDQLKFDGILLAPVENGYCQSMLKITKRRDKKGIKKEIKNIGDFVFVKLRGEYGY